MQKQHIPVQNIYYLLAYAWDHFRSGELVDVDQTRCPDTHNLLAMLLSAGIRRLATKGIDKGYVGFTEETPRLRGRIQVLPSYRRLTHVAGRMVCEFDELTADTLPNRILKATCQRLLQHSSPLTPENRSAVHAASRLLADITSIEITSSVFHRVQLHRNNRHYRLLLHVCQMLHELYLPEQQAGSRKFRDILENETVMHRLFESFVRQFAVRHCRDAKVSAMKIKWFGDFEPEVEKYLPGMITDVTLDRPHQKVILDCKYYRDAVAVGQFDERLRSGHLYQLLAYLQNKAHDDGWSDVVGKLLYPAVNHNLSRSFELLGHKIEIHSIDLDQPWPAIHDHLLKILN